MSSETPAKKEKKDKKRKSEAAELPVEPVAVPPAEGTASAEAVAMEVDGEQAVKKSKKDKKEKRKSLGADAAAEEQDVKVGVRVAKRRDGISTAIVILTRSRNSSSRQMLSRL